MAAVLAEEDIRQRALRLREDFLSAHSENSNMDPRDISKVQTNLAYVEKFVRHNRGHLESALNHMVECFTWRKSFGVNDIKYEDIDDSLWRSGMAMTHGFDIKGNNVVILSINKHRKNSKRAPMLQKWMAFCFEMHQKVYPQNKMCMMFDMTGAGLSQMDMDLIKFVVNCFKIYFPDILEWLLVYNMPWILQAAWKIVQGWLSEGAVTKVKFVTMETLQEYIPADNLLKKFGGDDQWEFDYDVEKVEMLRLLREHGITDENEMKDIPDEVEENSYIQGAVETGGASGGQASEGSLKQVRFSSGLPPTRQSRYGNDDKDPYASLSNSEQSILNKGSAISSGFRRRQVSRLMSLQETPQEKGLFEVSESLPVGSPRRHSVPLEVESMAVGDVMLSPAHELVFYGQKDNGVLCTLTLKNKSDNMVAYKIKTTAPLRYKVRPNLALISSKSVATVQVLLPPGSEVKTSQDKFLVQTHTFPDQVNVPKPDQLVAYWKNLIMSSIHEHRMRCRWMSELPSRVAIQGTQKDSEGGGTDGKKQRVITGNGEVLSGITLDTKVENLISDNIKLSRKVTQLQKLSYVTIFLLVLLVVIVIYY